MTYKMIPKHHFALLMVLVLLAVPVLVSAQDVTPAVTVSDQESDGTSVTIANVAAAVPGWIVIHIDADGRPGPVLGHTAVEVGDNSGVVVALDPPLTEETVLWAMLHVDEGTVGVYEFPGADVPVREGDTIVMTPFTALVATVGADVATSEAVTGTEEVAASEAVTATEEMAATETVTESAEVAASEAMTGTAEVAASEAVTATEEAAAVEAAAESAPATEEAAAPETMAEPAAPILLPVTGAGLGGMAAQTLPALAALSGLAGSIWLNRRRRS